jgi:radical SAM protein with 4Fe4S-binding SPASM domain
MATSSLPFTAPGTSDRPLPHYRPRTCVWELTLACDLRCGHCGSRAGKARPAELSTDECLRVVSQLAELGCERVTLSGGEPTMRPDWDTIGRALAVRGVQVNMVTNGAYRSEEAARAIAGRARDCGLCNVGVSIDGPEPVHDRQRGQGAFARALRGVSAFRQAGLSVGFTTTVDRRNLGRLEEVRQLAIDVGASLFRLQLAKPMGSMCEQRDAALRPEDLLELVPMLARMKRCGEIAVAVGDSIGYFGAPEEVLRGADGRGRRERWNGCQAGMQAIGLEADGGVKGCLSLQAKWGEKDPFLEGNVRERSLADIWTAPEAFAFNRRFSPDSLTGGCAGCRHARECRGGARCVSSAFHGTLTEDPYCYHRVSEQLVQLRRRKVAGAAATAVALALASACGGGASVSYGTGGGRDAGHDTEPGRDARPDVDCTGVCLECDYGLPVPPECWPHDAAVTRDAGHDAKPAEDAGTGGICANVCCDCEYGLPAPPECCVSDAGRALDAGRDAGAARDAGHDARPTEDAGDCAHYACDTDYGLPGPPPGCCLRDGG